MQMNALMIVMSGVMKAIVVMMKQVILVLNVADMDILLMSAMQNMIQMGII
jgi:hypothetical protein